MIPKFMTVYAGHVDLPDHGQDATPANERRFSNAQLASVFDKTEAIARVMDRCGWDTLWMAEHHFQQEGYEVIPNMLMWRCILPSDKEPQDRLRLQHRADVAPAAPGRGFACADILTKGRTVFGVGRGYHTREVETFGAPMLDQNANRELFEEQVEIIFKAFNNESSRTRASTTRCRRRCRIAATQLKELTLVPRPVHLPVECWQPVVSAIGARPGLHGEARHQGRGRRRRGDDASRVRSPHIQAAPHRAGKDLKLGENLMIGIVIHLADTKEQALKGLGRCTRSTPRCLPRSASCRA